MKSALAVVDKEFKNGNRSQTANDVFDKVGASKTVRNAYLNDVQRYLDELNGLSVGYKRSKDGVDAYNESQTKAGEQMLKNTTVFQDFKSGMASVGKTALSIGGNVLIDVAASYAINKAAEAWENYSNMQENAISKGNEALSKYKQTNSTMSEATSWIKENEDRYIELANKADRFGEQGSLTDSEFKEYNQLSAQMAEYIPSQISGYNSLGTAILSTSKSVDTLNEAFSTEKLTQYSEQASNFKDVIEKVKAEMYQDKGITKETGITNQMDAIKGFLDDYDKGRVTDAFENSSWYSPYGDSGTFYATNANLLDAMKQAGITGSGLLGDFTASDFTDSDNISTLRTYYQDLETQAETSAGAIKDFLPVLFQSDKAYQKLLKDHSDIDNMVGTMINGFDRNDIEQISGGNLSNQDPEEIEKNLREWRTGLVNDLKNEDTRNALTSLFSLDDKQTEMTYSQYKETAESAIDDVMKYTDAFTKDQLENSSGVHDSLDQLQTDYDNIVSRFKGDSGFSENYLNNDINTSQLEALSSLATDKTFEGNWEEALSQMDAVQRKSELSVANIQKSVESAKSLYSSIGSVISESLSGDGISQDTITSFTAGIEDAVKSVSGLEDIGVDSLLKTTAKGVQLNTSNLKDMLAMQNKVKQVNFADAIHAQNEEVAKQAKAVQDATEGTDEYTTATQSLKDAQADLIDLKYAQAQYNALYKQQQDALTDYADWINAQSTENAGDKYTNMVSGLKTALEAYNKGLTGTDDFKTFAKMISPTGSTDEANFAENYAKAARYLTDDEKGVTNFLNDLKANDLADYNDQTKEWAINVQDVAEAAKKMGMGKDFMSNMFGRLEDYGFHNNVVSDTQDGIMKLTDAYGNLADAQSRLKELKDTDPGNTTAIQAAEDEVKGYQQDIEDLKGNIKEAAKQSVSDYASEIDAAKTKMDVLKQAREDTLTGDYDDKTKQALVDQIEAEMRTLQSEYSSLFEDLDLKSAEEIQQASDYYKEAVKNATVNKPATPDFGDDTEAAQNYADTLGMVQKAYNDGDKTVNDAISTLSQFTAEEVKGIDLFDGKLDGDKLAPAEKALDSLVEKFGLTKEQAQMLGTVFESMGRLKNEDSTTSTLDEIQEKGKEAQETLEQTTGKTYKLDFDTTDMDTVQKQLKEIEDEVDKHVTTDENGNPKYTGSQELEDTYKASVAQEQNAEYKNSAIGKSTSTDEIVQAAQDFMKAKNEMDAQTQYAQKGMTNTLDDATEKANTAYETFKNLTDKNGINSIDTSDIQKTEDSLLGMDSDETLKVKADVDTTDAESKIQDLKNLDGSSVTINADVSTNGGAEELESSLASIPQGVSTTVNCTVEGQSDVDNLESAMESVPDNTPVTLSCHVENQEQLDQLESKADELNASGKNIQIDATIGDLKTDGAAASTPVEVTGNVTTLTASAGLTPVAVTGNVVQLTGNPSQPVDVTVNATSVSGSPSGTVDVTANATNVSGNPSGTVDVQGNVTEASGSPSGTVDVKGNVTSVSGNPSGTVDVRGNLTGINNAENQSVSAKGTVEYTGVFPKQADTVKGTADYNPGVFPTSAPSVSGEAIYSGVFPTTAPSLTGTVTYHATVTGVPTKLWTGTMSAPASIPAHAFGTAYNAINFGNAYANGKVGLQHNEVALVNELGQESIVRGDRWLMLPPGMHTQALKKGDIVLNAQQTADLKKHGKATGTARALAHGSLTDIAPAHAGLRGTINANRNLGGSNNKSSSTDKTTKAVEKAAKDTSKAAAKASKWTDPWKNVKDWFERVVTKLQGIIDLNKAKSDNTYDYNKQNSYANNSISTTETLISKYQQAEKMYTKKSDQYAKKIGLSSKLKKKVQNGTVNIESLSAVNKQKVDAYQKWYDKILNCKKQIEELKTKEKELYKQKLDNITTRYDALIGVYSKANDSLDGLNSWREEIGASQAVGSDYYNAVQQKVNNGNQMRTYYKDEISALTKEYGNIVKKYGADSTFAKETLAQIEELKNTFYENEKTTAENTNKLAELNMTMAENEVDKYTRASDALSSYRDFKEKNSYKHSDYGNVTENDYVEAMKVNDKTILAYQHQKDLILTEMAKVSVDSPKYQEYAKQLADVNKNILEANNDTADLKKSLVELRFKPLEDARDTIELLVTDLDNLRDMMDSDTFMNDDGSMTKQGLANIALLNKASEATKQQLANDKAQLETIQQMYDNDLLTEDQYKQYIKDINSDIQKSSKAIYSYQQSLMQVYLDQISKENDYLQENINKRKTALTAKKDYYDYDKTLKSKNKDIDTIKAQIAALEGTTNAAAKARLEQLKADLKDKEDDLADTKYQHQIEMEEKGYENLSDQANDTLDKTTQAVKSNSDLQKSIIDNMLKETQKSYADAYEQIEEIIKNTGYSVSESFDEIIAKAKLTSEEVKKVSPSVTASGEGVDNQRTDKNQADQYTKNAANSSSTGTNATKDYSNANPSANDLSESGISGQQNAQLNNNLSESMKEYNAKKSALQQWYNGVGGDVDKTKLKEKHHDFYTYFWKKGKNVRQKDFEEVARILGHNYIIKQPYSKWKKSWKDKIFNELKGYGFSNGGVINSVIPMDSNSIYGEYLSRSDDTGMIFARPGESVMTEKFTELLKPSLATMDQFTKLANPQGILPNTQMTNQDITFSPNIEINVDNISNDMDLKHLGKELSDIMYPMFTKRMRKDLSRSSGKNR